MFIQRLRFKLPVLALGLLLCGSHHSSEPLETLKALSFTAQSLPEACRFEKAPGLDWLCPVPDNPFYSTQPEALHCLQSRLFGARTQTPQAQAALIQGLLPAQSNSGEVGMFALAFDSQKNALAFARHSRFQPLLESRPKTDTEALFVEQAMVVYFWQDGDNICADALKARIQQHLFPKASADGGHE